MRVERRVEGGDVGGVDVQDGVSVGCKLLEEADVLGGAVGGRGRCCWGEGGGRERERKRKKGELFFASLLLKINLKTQN